MFQLAFDWLLDQGVRDRYEDRTRVEICNMSALIANLKLSLAQLSKVCQS
jgi:hypothetical protein